MMLKIKKKFKNIILIYILKKYVSIIQNTPTETLGIFIIISQQSTKLGLIYLCFRQGKKKRARNTGHLLLGIMG